MKKSRSAPTAGDSANLSNAKGVNTPSTSASAQVGQAPHAIPGLSKHRLEALTDGIFAVAMTLLVLEIKLPEIKQLVGNAASLSLAEFNRLVVHSLEELQPRLLAWLISFLILAVFWLSHQSIFRYVRTVDRKLLWLNLIQLLFISLVPFSSSLVGQYTLAAASTLVYAGNLAALSIISLLHLRYLQQHSELCHEPIPKPFARAAMIRSFSLLATAALACAIAWWWHPAFATMAFMLMWVATAVARRLEPRS
jgi:uncharacterized membrane protein